MVVGASLSGLTAAKHLSLLGANVTVIEMNGGGSIPFKLKTFDCLNEIYGNINNPFSVLAHQVNIHLFFLLFIYWILSSAVYLCKMCLRIYLSLTKMARLFRMMSTNFIKISCIISLRTLRKGHLLSKIPVRTEIGHLPVSFEGFLIWNDHARSCWIESWIYAISSGFSIFSL